MKTRKLLALIMTIALALTLFACGASGTGKGTPPFSKVSLDCSEDDVVKAYGECSNISTNDQGGNVYTYLSDYKGKDGAVYISFGADGKPISIQWILKCLICRYLIQAPQQKILTNALSLIWFCRF